MLERYLNKNNPNSQQNEAEILVLQFENFLSGLYILLRSKALNFTVQISTPKATHSTHG